MAPESESTPTQHWDRAYDQRGVSGVSWYQETPTVSLALIEELGIARTCSIIDVGGGSSSLASSLVSRGFSDVTVLDVSQSAIDLAKERNGDGPISYVHANLLGWKPTRRFDLWHDRALLHFFTEPEDRARYLILLREVVAPGGAVIMATFAEDGPEHCSGLPVARYTSTQLAALLAPDFVVVSERREQHGTPAGVTQPFTWVAARRK